MKKIVLFVFFISSFAWSQEYGKFTDPRDGKTYRTVKIGNQVWMAENLNYDAGTGSWCYNNDTSNCSKYGRLYSWETAKRVAPPGWHLPSDDELATLCIYLGTDDTTVYKQIIPGGSSGFNALFGGWRDGKGKFHGIGKIENGAYFWSSTEYVDLQAWYLGVSSHDQGASTYYSKDDAFSVRCIKD